MQVICISFQLLPVLFFSKACLIDKTPLLIWPITWLTVVLLIWWDLTLLEAWLLKWQTDEKIVTALINIVQSKSANHYTVSRCVISHEHSFVVLLSVWMNPHSWAMGDFDRLSFHINAWCILKHWTRVKTLLLNFQFNFVPHENYIYPFTKHGLWIADDRNTHCLFYITHRKSYQFISLQFAVRTNAAECNTSVMCSLQGFAFKAVSWQRVHIMWLSVHKPDSWVYSSLTDTLTVSTLTWFIFGYTLFYSTILGTYYTLY